jgi:hypothetical protein
VAVALDQPCVEAVLEEVARAVVALVEPHRVEAVEAVHSVGEPLSGRRDDEVDVVRHQAERARRPFEALHGVPEEEDEGFVVAVVEEDLGPSDAPSRYVVRAVSQEVSRAARHVLNVRQRGRSVPPRAPFGTHSRRFRHDRHGAKRHGGGTVPLQPVEQVAVVRVEDWEGGAQE